MLPVTRPGGGARPITASAVIDLPQPLSPTTPRVLPGGHAVADAGDDLADFPARHGEADRQSPARPGPPRSLRRPVLGRSRVVGWLVPGRLHALQPAAARHAPPSRRRAAGRAVRGRRRCAACRPTAAAAWPGPARAPSRRCRRPCGRHAEPGVVGAAPVVRGGRDLPAGQASAAASSRRRTEPAEHRHARRTLRCFRVSPNRVRGGWLADGGLDADGAPLALHHLLLQLPRAHARCWC